MRCHGSLKRGRWLPPRAVIAAVALLGAGAAHAQAGTPQDRAVPCAQDAKRLGSAEIRLIEASLRLDLEVEGGYEFIRAPVVECLTKAQSLTYEVELKQGRVYAIVAVCERDFCNDIDLTVYAGPNRPVGADTDAGAGSRVDFEARRDGPHTIRVLAPGCQAPEGCAIAFGAFTRKVPR